MHALGRQFWWFTRGQWGFRRGSGRLGRLGRREDLYDRVGTRRGCEVGPQDGRLQSPGREGSPPGAQQQQPLAADRHQARPRVRPLRLGTHVGGRRPARRHPEGRRVGACTHAKVVVFLRACKHAPYRSASTGRFPTKTSPSSPSSRPPTSRHSQRSLST